MKIKEIKSYDDLECFKIAKKKMAEQFIKKTKKPKLDKWWLQTKGRKLTRKGLVGKADTAFSLFIRARDGRCVTCGSMEKLQCGHLFSRVSYSIRWDELNCHCQCEGCNQTHEYDTHPFTSWFIHKFGLEAYDQLHAKAKKTAKELKGFKDRDLAEIMRMYQQKLNQLNLNNKI